MFRQHRVWVFSPKGISSRSFECCNECCLQVVPLRFCPRYHAANSTRGVSPHRGCVRGNTNINRNTRRVAPPFKDLNPSNTPYWTVLVLIKYSSPADNYPKQKKLFFFIPHNDQLFLLWCWSSVVVRKAIILGFEVGSFVITGFLCII